MAECELQIPKIEGLPDDVLTVGRKFILDCKGSFPSPFKAEAWVIEFGEKQNPHSLKILSSNAISPNEIKMEATSYVAGPTEFKDLKLKYSADKDANSVELGPVQFQVQSVIQQQEKPPEPFGPIALSLNWPLVWWMVLAGLVLLALSFIGLKIRKSTQRKNLLESLRKHDSALTPLAEVHKYYRQWRREKSFFYDSENPAESLSDFLKEVDQIFRLYLTRTFKVPALQWTDRSVLTEIKKYHAGTFETLGLELKKLMIEMAKAKDAKNLKSKDVVQLTENFRVLAEKISKAQDAGSAAGRIR